MNNAHSITVGLSITWQSQRNIPCVQCFAGVWCVLGAGVCCKAVKLFRCQQLLCCGARRRQRHHNRGCAPSARSCSALYLVIGGRCVLRQTTKINAELQIYKTIKYVLFSHMFYISISISQPFQIDTYLFERKLFHCNIVVYKITTIYLKRRGQINAGPWLQIPSVPCWKVADCQAKSPGSWYWYNYLDITKKSTCWKRRSSLSSDELC